MEKIGEVVSGSDCEKAGTQGGMKLLSVNGKPVKTYREAIDVFVEAAMLHGPNVEPPPKDPNADPNAKPWKPPKEVEARALFFLLQISSSSFLFFSCIVCIHLDDLDVFVSHLFFL
jgi:hypothetical protein